MTLYDLTLATVIAVGMIASGSFLARFRPKVYPRFHRDVLPLWLPHAALFALFGWVGVRMALGLTTQPATVGEATGGILVGLLVDVALVSWALMYRRHRVASTTPQRRATDHLPETSPAAAEAELDPLALFALGARIEANQTAHATAVRHLVEVIDRLREVVEGIRSDNVAVAADLVIAQRAVDAVAEDLRRSQGRADSIEDGPDYKPGQASDAGARSDPERGAE